MTDGSMERDDLVQRYLDGDLTPEEARLVRELMASDPSFQEDARAYRRIGDLMREMSGAEVDRPGLDAAWSGVQGRLAGVQGGPDARAGDADPSHALVWLSEVARHRMRFWIPAAGLTAVAASIVVVLALQTAVPEVPAAIQEVAGLGSRVTDFSLNSTSTTVLMVETGSGGTAAVLWVSDDDEDTAAAENGNPSGGGAQPPAGAGKGQRI